MMRALAAAALLTIAAACTPTDVGACCQVAPGADPSIIPEPAFDSTGAPANAVAVDPKLLCAEIACVSYRGSSPYCTEACEFDSNCPGDFECVAVIASDPGEAASIGPTKFCVKQDHVCE